MRDTMVAAGGCVASYTNQYSRHVLRWILGDLIPGLGWKCSDHKYRASHFSISSLGAKCTISISLLSELDLFLRGDLVFLVRKWQFAAPEESGVFGKRLSHWLIVFNTSRGGGGDTSGSEMSLSDFGPG